MTIDRPKLSIGLPVYNGDVYLGATIDGLLNQTFSDFEIVISDNASTDGTREICDRYVENDERVRVFHADKNLGAAWNFNNTFYQARGEYFKWAAHDDLHAPTFIERCVDYLDRNAECVLCFTGTDFIGADGNKIREYRYPLDFAGSTRRQRFRHFAAAGHIVHEIFGVIRSDILKRTPLIGGYAGSDLVLLGLLSLYGNFHQIPEQLFMHREHEQRSTIAPQGADNFTQWYDASKSGRYVMPHWRRLFENAKIALGFPMPAAEKLSCLASLGRVANWQRRELASEVARLFRS